MTTLFVLDGEDVVAFLAGLAAPDGAWVNGVGALEDVDARAVAATRANGS